jgi:hypothetical protein
MSRKSGWFPSSSLTSSFFPGVRDACVLWGAPLGPRLGPPFRRARRRGPRMEGSLRVHEPPARLQVRLFPVYHARIPSVMCCVEVLAAPPP